MCLRRNIDFHAVTELLHVTILIFLDQAFQNDAKEDRLHVLDGVAGVFRVNLIGYIIQEARHQPEGDLAGFTCPISDRVSL